MCIMHDLFKLFNYISGYFSFSFLITGLSKPFKIQEYLYLIPTYIRYI